MTLEAMETFLDVLFVISQRVELCLGPVTHCFSHQKRHSFLVQLMVYMCHSVPYCVIAGWWFGTFFIFPYIGDVIIPIDFHIFQRGRAQPPTR